MNLRGKSPRARVEDVLCSTLLLLLSEGAIRGLAYGKAIKGHAQGGEVIRG